MSRGRRSRTRCQHQRSNDLLLRAEAWGWFYLSTILDDYSRHIIAWKLGTTMKAADGFGTVKAFPF